MFRQTAKIVEARLEHEIEVELLVGDWRLNKDAEGLIRREHYRPTMPPGDVLICRALDRNVVKEIRGSVAIASTSDPCLLGALVLSGGCAYSKPNGRRELAAMHFPKIEFDEVDRGTIVKEMGLRMIRRVAVDPSFRSFGIGTLLARYSRRAAVELTPDARYIEVMTSRRHKEAQAVVNGTANKTDFLVRAGFKPASIITRSRAGHSEYSLYYWAAVDR